MMAPSMHEERWDAEIREELRRVRDELEWLEAELHDGNNHGGGGGSKDDDSSSHTSTYSYLSSSHRPYA